MTMVLAVGLGSSGCDLSGGSKFETITDAGISNAEEIDVSEEETLIVVETSEAVPETDESMGAGGFFGYNRIQKSRKYQKLQSCWKKRNRWKQQNLI